MNNSFRLPFLSFLFSIVGQIILVIEPALIKKHLLKKYSTCFLGFFIASITVFLYIFPTINSSATLQQERFYEDSSPGKETSGEFLVKESSSHKISIHSDKKRKKSQKIEEIPKPLKIKNITFRIESDEKERVFIHSNNLYHPIVFGLEGERPRVVIDIKKTSYFRKGLSKIPVNGRVIKQIRAHLHRDSKKLRVVLDLQPWESYTVNQSVYKIDNGHIFALEIEAKNVAKVEENVMEEGKLPYRPKGEKWQKLSLRRVAHDLTVEDIKDILIRYNFYSSCWNYNGDFCNPTGEFDNNFMDNGNGTVTDLATGLIWQKSGTSRVMSWEEAKDYVKQFNQNRFGGYTDWHLPTIEELASLMEESWKNGDMFIDPVFDIHQKCFWSSDTCGTDKAWKANYHLGFIMDSQVNYKNAVRAVRSLKTAESLSGQGIGFFKQPLSDQ